MPRKRTVDGGAPPAAAAAGGASVRGSGGAIVTGSIVTIPAPPRPPIQSESRVIPPRLALNAPSLFFAGSSSSSAAEATMRAQEDPEYIKAQEQRESLLESLLTERNETGARPRAPAQVPSIEIRKRARSLWSSVLEEMTWVATDVSQERVFKNSQRKHVALALADKRTTKKRSNVANAIEKFWETYGGPVDGRPQKPSPELAPLERRPSDDPNSPLLFPSVAGNDINAMSAKQRLSAVRRLMHATALKSTNSISTSPYFSGVLSPLQFHTLKRIAQLTRFGLGAIAADSDKADHRSTIAAFLAFLASEQEVPGPHLICCTEALDMMYFRAVVATKCPDLRVTTLPADSTDDADVEMNGNAGAFTFGPRDVVICPFGSSFSMLSRVEVDWGTVVFSLGNSAYGEPATTSSAPPPSTNSAAPLGSEPGSTPETNGLLSPSPSPTFFALPQLPRSQRWGRPIFVLNGQLSSIFSKNNVSNAVLQALGLEVHQLSDVVASSSPSLFAAHIREDADFPVMELLVACPETSEQKLKRRVAKGDRWRQELAAIHSNLHAAAALASPWSADPVPPPRRSYSSSAWSIDGITKHSGKFVEAMNLILSHRCRRALVLSTRKLVLDAFSAVASLNLICYRMDKGTMQARVASWTRFLDTDFACLLARPVDLDHGTNRKMNGAVDSVILLDCYTSEADVTRIKAVVKHATVFRLFTRGTIEQSDLEAAQHPSLILPAPPSTSAASGATAPATGATGVAVSNIPSELKVIVRTSESLEPSVEDAPESVQAGWIAPDERCASIKQYAVDFSTGKSGSSAFHGSLGNVRSLGVQEEQRTLEMVVPLFYDAKTAKPQQQQIAPPPQRGKGSLAPLPVTAPPAPVFTAMNMFNFQMVSENVQEPVRSMPVDRERFVASFSHKREGAVTPPLQARKKQPQPRGSTASSIGIDETLYAGSFLPPSVTAPVGTTSSSLSRSANIPLPSSGGPPFSAIEDDVIREVMDRHGLNALLAADMLSGSRILRNGLDGVPAVTRTGRDVTDRFTMLQRSGNLTITAPQVSTMGADGVENIAVSAGRVREEDPRQYWWFVPPSDLPADEVRAVAASRFQFWRGRGPKQASFTFGTTVSPPDGAGESLHSVAATSERRIGPLELLASPPAPPAGQAHSGTTSQTGSHGTDGNKE